MRLAKENGTYRIRPALGPEIFHDAETKAKCAEIAAAMSDEVFVGTAVELQLSNLCIETGKRKIDLAVATPPPR